jgi:hypothetical protein
MRGPRPVGLARTGLLPVLGLLLLPLGAGASGDAGPPAERPCIPGWYARFAAPVSGPGAPAIGGDLRVEYASLIQFPMSSEIFCAGPDDSPTLSRFYAGNYAGDTVTRHTVDVNLQHWQDPLPIPDGQSWLATDLDRDGQTELVLQRGDTGMGGNGYLDIVSAPNWTLRAHITLAGMKVYFYPVAIDVDADPYLELYLTPSSLGGTARAMIVDYDPGTGGFAVTHSLAAPNGTGGATAAGDFDADGRVEFITGGSSGYHLFECAGGALLFRGPVGQGYAGNWATALRPVPGGAPHALLGHSSFDQGYRYQLLRATGDNAFEVVQVFQEVTGWAGIHPSYGLDADGDGLDEFAMNLYPLVRLYEWDATADAFVEIWHWDQGQTGTLLAWDRSDLDRDGVPEWCCANHNNLFRAFEDQDASPAGARELRPAGPRLPLAAAPNPFLARTRLTRATPDALELVDAGGRVLRRWAPGGPAALEWNGRDDRGAPVPAGVYYARTPGADRIACRLIRLR